ncbi:MAG: hypothetical protein ABI587_08910 [Gemmatimonadales bacterium]
MPVRIPLLTLGILVGVVSASAAQGNAPTAGCPKPESHQFDFWEGDWNVTDPTGKVVGTNLVTSEEGGCLIHEHWSGGGGSTGQSFNFYETATGLWNQVWVDNFGTVLRLSGNYADRVLRLTGVAAGPGGKPQQQRLAFFRNADGSVRQLWETSDDEGKTWAVAFDGLYRKKP